MARSKENLEYKLLKTSDGELFIEEVQGLTIDQLEARITRMQKALDESEEHRENNTVLKEAKEKVSSLSGPYNDVKKAVKLKTQFLIALIKEKGGQ